MTCSNAGEHRSRGSVLCILFNHGVVVGVGVGGGGLRIGCACRHSNLRLSFLFMLQTSGEKERYHIWTAHNIIILPICFFFVFFLFCTSDQLTRCSACAPTVAHLSQHDNIRLPLTPPSVDMHNSWAEWSGFILVTLRQETYNIMWSGRTGQGVSYTLSFNYQQTCSRHAADMHHTVASDRARGNNVSSREDTCSNPGQSTLDGGHNIGKTTRIRYTRAPSVSRCKARVLPRKWQKSKN